MSEIQVTQLSVYPIKGCGGIAISKAIVTETGLQHDRQFMLVDGRNKMITQRNAWAYEKLVNLHTSLGTYTGPIEGEPNGKINVEAEGFGRLELSTFLPLHRRREDLRVVKANVHNNAVEGVRVGGDADEFFSEYFGRRVKLLQAAGFLRRKLDPDYAKEGASNTAGFADSNPILLASMASARQLSTHPLLAAEFPDGVGIGRFRPNVVVDAPGLSPYDEDYWRFLRFEGALGAHVIKASKRCPVPNIDQQTAAVSKSITKALKDTRRGVTIDHKARGVFFGQNPRHVFKIGQAISLLDRVAILERSEVPNVILEASSNGGTRSGS